MSFEIGPQMLQEIDQFRTEVTNLQRDLQSLTDKYKRAALLGGNDEEAVRPRYYVFRNCFLSFPNTLCALLQITSIEDRQKMRTDTQRLSKYVKI
jgi:hypothetical protein